jgi:hypothetical protein
MLPRSPPRHGQPPVTESAACSRPIQRGHHMPEAESQTTNPALTSTGRPRSTAKEFVEFWLQNSVHADEQMTGRRGREAILKLADRLVVAANYQGFSNQQIEEEIGDIYTYIRTSIDAKNAIETTRLRFDGN